MSTVGVRVAPYALLIGLAPTLWLTHIHVRTTARDSSRDQQFAQAIQRDAPIPANGGTLYVVNAPKLLTFYDDFSLEKLTQLYLGDITVKSLSAPDAARLEPSLPAGDRIYRYAP